MQPNIRKSPQNRVSISHLSKQYGVIDCINCSSWDNHENHVCVAWHAVKFFVCTHVIFLCPPCWHPSNVNKSLHFSHFTMVLCAMVDCGRKTGKGKGLPRFEFLQLYSSRQRNGRAHEREKNAMDFCDKPRLGSLVTWFPHTKSSQNITDPKLSVYSR